MLSKVQAHSRPSGNISDHFKHKQPPPPLLVSVFAPCHCQPQWWFVGMEGFHGFHLQIGFNLLKQIFSQAHKSFIFFQLDISIAANISISSHSLKIGGCKGTFKSWRHPCYMGHDLTYTQLNTDTLEVCRYVNDMLILLGRLRTESKQK